MKKTAGRRKRYKRNLNLQAKGSPTVEEKWGRKSKKAESVEKKAESGRRFTRLEGRRDREKMLAPSRRKEREIRTGYVRRDNERRKPRATALRGKLGGEENEKVTSRELERATDKG